MPMGRMDLSLFLLFNPPGVHLTTANRNYLSAKGQKANRIIGLSDLDD
jgi:hypothetical protein